MRHSVWTLGLLLTGMVGLGLSAPDVLRIGAFSEQDPRQAHPDGWQPISFAKIDTKTTYDLVRADSGTVVRARSDGVVADGDARTKEGDDYPARIYVMFDYEDLGIADQVKLAALRALGYDEIPTRALNYVWANRVDRHTILENAYTDWVMMVAPRSGTERAGEWVTERRNVLADYRAAFGGDPPPVTGVAIMTDTDNTDGEATAYYGDILFRAAEDSVSGPSSD